MSYTLCSVKSCLVTLSLSFYLHRVCGVEGVGIEEDTLGCRYIKHIYIIFPRLGEREGTRDLRGDGPCSIGHVYQLFGLRHLLLLLPHSVYNPYRHIIIGPTTSHTHPPTPPDATRHHHRRRMWSRRLLNISHSHKKREKRHGKLHPRWTKMQSK